MKEHPYRPITRSNFRDVPQIDSLTEDDKFAVEVVSTVLPFRANNYVVEELIDWSRVPDDPIYRLTFPQREMLAPQHFRDMANLLVSEAPSKQIQEAANRIRWQLNPHPGGQLEHNLPTLNGHVLQGMQHKYRETVLFFPSQGQTCHAYCTFCFRWPQFVGINELKLATRQTGQLISYLQEHPEVTDVLITGGDPLIMRAANLAAYIEPLLQARLPHLQTIRIGTKSLSYWPYRFLTDSDAEETLVLFERIVQRGLHLTVMAHINHPNELKTGAVREAVRRVRETGAQIRTQSPIMRHINDSADVWSTLWREQVNLGMIPYYMFIARDTGAQHYFSLPLVKCYRIFKQAYSQVSGICRTVRGPSMSAAPGKVQIIGTPMIYGDKTIALQFLQGRDPNWVLQPFFAEYDEGAVWFDDLRPALGADHFFHERTLPIPNRNGQRVRLVA